MKIAKKMPGHRSKSTEVGAWNARLRRRDPMHLLQQAEQGRVASLLPLKHKRMAVSPFTFFRGAAALMAYDLSLAANMGVLCQICGDAHVQNLGAYAGADGRLVFDINDFDETIRAPFEWDVKRMATSILLAGSQAKVKSGGTRSAAEEFLNSYCTLLEHLSKLPVLEAARYQVRRLNAVKPLGKILGKAERSTPVHSRDQLMTRAKSGYIFRSEPPVLRRVAGKEKATVLAALAEYSASLLPERRHFFSQLEPIDVAFKVVGTGSVGTRDYCVYLQGNGEGDPLFLQIKQEMPSVYAPYLPHAAAPQSNNGQRVAEGQRAMQLQSDPMLGFTRFGGHDCLVRQLNDHKASLDVTTLNRTGLTEYAKVCGEMLARGHARSGDVRAIAESIGGGKRFRQGMAKFAGAYAEQTVADWKTFRRQKQ